MLLPLILSHPQLMERPQTSQNTSSQPSRVLPLDGISRAMDLDLASRDPLCQFEVESIGETRKETAAADDDNVLQARCTVIDVELKDRVVHEIRQADDTVQAAGRFRVWNLAESRWKRNGLEIKVSPHPNKIFARRTLSMKASGRKSISGN